MAKANAGVILTDSWKFTQKDRSKNEEAEAYIRWVSRSLGSVS